jgi:hypothetical protein
MAHIISVLGESLREMLILDGWTLDWERNARCAVSKDGKFPRGFPLHVGLPVRLVKSIADTAGWDAARFEELYHQVITTKPKKK